MGVIRSPALDTRRGRFLSRADKPGRLGVPVMNGPRGHRVLLCPGCPRHEFSIYGLSLERIPRFMNNEHALVPQFPVLSLWHESIVAADRCGTPFLSPALLSAYDEQSLAACTSFRQAYIFGCPLVRSGPTYRRMIYGDNGNLFHSKSQQRQVTPEREEVSGHRSDLFREISAYNGEAI